MLYGGAPFVDVGSKSFLLVLHPCVPRAAADGDQDPKGVRARDSKVEDNDREQYRQNLLHVR